MNKTKRAVALVISLVMLAALLSACGDGGNPSDSPGSSSGSSPSSNGSAGTSGNELPLDEYTDIMILSPLMGTGTAEPPDQSATLYVQYVLEKFNIDMSNTRFLSATESADFYGSLGLMIASGTMPDVICMWTTAEAVQLAHQFADAGMILDVESYLRGSMPNTMKDLTEVTINNYRNPADGKLYIIPSFAINPDNTETEYTMEPNLTLVKREDIFNELNLANPKTPDEFYDVLQKLSALPDVNGRKFIPFQTLLGVFDAEMFIGGMMGVFKNRDVWVDAERRTTMLYEFPEYLEFLKFFTKLYREDLLDPDLFINSYDTCYAKVEEGRVGIYVDWPNNINGNVSAIQANIPTADYQAMPIPKLPGLSKTDYWQTATMGGLITIVNKDFKEMDRLIQFLDWQMSEEGYWCGALGGPSKDRGFWYFDDNGVGTYNLDVIPSLQQENPTYMNSIAGGWVYFLLGRLVYHPETQGLKVNGISNPRRLLAKDYNIGEVYLNQQAEIYAAIPPGEVELAKLSAVQKVFDDGIAKLVTTCNNDAEVEAAYEQMMSDAIRAGYTDVMKERYERIQLFDAGALN